MSDFMLSTVSRVQVARHTMVEALVGYAQAVGERARREQTGQDMVEYAGVLIVVAAVVLACVQLGPTVVSALSSGVTKEINKIFNGGK